jgi:hypothetical protein
MQSYWIVISGVFARSGYRFASRKRVKTNRKLSPDPSGPGLWFDHRPDRDGWNGAADFF